MRPQHLELFASAAVSPEALWGVVGDLRRLPEWTDAEDAALQGREPVGPGTSVVTRDGQRTLNWTVTTLEPRVLELATTLPQGSLGTGVSVVREAMGARARIILAAKFDPSSAAAAWRFRLAGGPALRRRFDAWTYRALAVAARDLDAPDAFQEPSGSDGRDHGRRGRPG